MTLPELQSSLDRLGVGLTLDGDRLKVDAPPGVLTAAIKAELVTHKPALIRKLVSGDPDAVNALNAQSRPAVASPPPAVGDDEPADVPEAAAGSILAEPPLQGTSCPPTVAGPPIPVEWQGAHLDGHWRPAIACWPIAWRQLWADRTDVHEAEGCAWNAAEYRAWRETIRDLGEAEARREIIGYRDPPEGLSDRAAIDQIRSFTWGEDDSQPGRNWWSRRDRRGAGQMAKEGKGTHGCG
jgi:hypothetical protein